MARAEDELVRRLVPQLQERLGPELVVEQGRNLLYEIAVDHHLRITADAKAVSRGVRESIAGAAFQTDLLVSSPKGPQDDGPIPRVVMEFKLHAYTDQVMAYAARATRHKTVYPYLRYGMVFVRGEPEVPRRVLAHMAGLDFCLAAAVEDDELVERLTVLVTSEVKASMALGRLLFEGERCRSIVRSFQVEALASEKPKRKPARAPDSA